MVASLKRLAKKSPMTFEGTMSLSQPFQLVVTKALAAPRTAMNNSSTVIAPGFGTSITKGIRAMGIHVAYAMK